ncbi:tripartite tricarboxylate transporter permease [Lutispora sp.]|uniref:tripartite tricarboxylate transporter permease n=1 Tax=Lutispora sp. TaxID=2828727 RepID=UPI002B201455|nr:tripartite tricarboxylate transporter permease [Lutispora sp.]MEA4960750.1 tripartite tricarboxylate transporter permease [Lutispora sp.]
MELLISGFQLVLNPVTFLYIVGGTVLGVIFGAMPGVSASMAVVLGMTFTYTMSPLVSIAFLVAVYCAAITGGGITAILFKIPGTPSSAPTTFDGYPMAMGGESGKALGISLVSSAIGGIFAALAMFLLTPQLVKVALKFGPSELFAISFLGLSVLTCLDSGNVIQTIISGLIGLWLATIGMDPIMGFARFTWGNSTLLSGIEMIPVMIGMFAITEVLRQTVKRTKMENLDKTTAKVKTKLTSIKELWVMKWTIFRSAVLGTIIGILPGAGATIASFLAYTTEVKMSKNPEKYGKGEPAGIAAPETANNAATGGSMVPLLALGIPGGNAAAIMMSALVLKGVQMGPMLLKRQPEFLSSVFASMIVTNIIMVIVAMGIATIFSKILAIPYSVLGTVIILLAAIGSFALSNSTGDVMLMVIAGVLGYIFNKFGFNAAALILGLVLGEMCEANLRRAVMLENGSIVAVFTKPITAILIIACIAMLVYPMVKPYIQKKKEKVAA